MGRRRALFSDLDGTLCFHEEAHGVRPVGHAPDGALIVTDAAGGRHRAHDVSTSSYRIYVADETLALLRALRERYLVVLVTGGRPSTVESRRDLFGFVDGVILENGGVIFDASFAAHPGWHQRLEVERRLLPAVKHRLVADGWAVDDTGRTSALRVRLRDNPGKGADAFARLCRDLPLPDGLRKTMNLENLDVILAGAGKENAVRFWIEQHAIDPAATVGVGDDVNDIGFLRETGERWVLASAYPPALAEAHRGRWNVSRGSHIDGINEILRTLLARDG